MKILKAGTVQNSLKTFIILSLYHILFNTRLRAASTVFYTGNVALELTVFKLSYLRN